MTGGWLGDCVSCDRLEQAEINFELVIAREEQVLELIEVQTLVGRFVVLGALYKDLCLVS